MTIIRQDVQDRYLILGVAVMLARAEFATAAWRRSPEDPVQAGEVSVAALRPARWGKPGPMLRIDNNGTGYALQLLV